MSFNIYWLDKVWLYLELLKTFLVKFHVVTEKFGVGIYSQTEIFAV